MGREGAKEGKSLEEMSLAEVRSSMTEMQLAFADHWLVCRSRVKAAELAGYSGGYSALATTGCRTLQSAKVQRLLALYFEAGGASGEEAADVLSRQMRTRMGEFLNDRGEIDRDKVRSAGPGIIQSWDENKGVLRLYSAQDAAKIIYGANSPDRHAGHLSGNVTITFQPAAEHEKVRSAHARIVDKTKKDKPID